jgi:amino acid transporter
MNRSEKKPPRKLGELASTAICGNDISSSCLYVSALSILYAGKWAPLVLLMVAGVLFLFRSIYTEVVGALPLNGGAYNALLNTTSKSKASIAACLTILSYMATAVISASEASHYAHNFIPHLPIMGATIGLLVFFTILTIIGISESAALAIGIFLFHLFSLTILLVGGGIYLFQHGFGVLSENLATPAPGGVTIAIFFGFSAAMLGISGFESSANFVEEQDRGVFPKTLRNMWIVVSFFNPVIAILALALIPISEVPLHQEALLAHLGGHSSGNWLATMISIDATLVLSGAVLTSFVGVNGLMHRMTLDRCLPQFLLAKNRRGTTHRILISFLLLTISVLVITRGDLKALAGVYTLSFLSVMVLFALGNILLKIKRASLPRPRKATWPTVILAMFAVLAALIGNAVMNPAYLAVFLEYFIPAFLIIAIMLQRTLLLQLLLFILRQTTGTLIKPLSKLSSWIRKEVEQINAQQVVFFTRGDNIANLNQVMLYVRRNEHTRQIKMVHVTEDPDIIPPGLEEELRFLDEAYPDIDIQFIVEEGRFSPDLISRLSKEWNIPANFMFIGCPGDGLSHDLADLGGVRVIV